MHRRRLLTTVAAFALSASSSPKAATRVDREAVEIMSYVPPQHAAAIVSGRLPAQDYIQAALRSGARKVLAPRGVRLLVEPVGVKTMGKAVVPYCIAVPSGVEFDLQGAALEIRPQHRAAILVNEGLGTVEDSGIRIVNGSIDGGNGIDRDAPRSLEVGCITLHGVRESEIRNVTVTGARQYAGRFLKCRECKFSTLKCLSSNGDGWSFGVDFNDQQVVDSVIDRIAAHNCEGVHPGLVGNGAIFTVQGCRVGSVFAANCAGGVKIQDSSRDSAFADLVFVGGANGTANSGIKVQGTQDRKLVPTNIIIDRVQSRDSSGEGLAIRFVGIVKIGSYLGQRNSRLLKNRDVDMRGDDVQVGQIVSEASFGEGLSIPGSGQYRLGHVTIEDAREAGFHIANACRCDVQELILSRCEKNIVVTHEGVRGSISSASIVQRGTEDPPPLIKSIASDFHVCALRHDGLEERDDAC
jgi:hypothetical protein